MSNIQQLADVISTKALVLSKAEQSSDSKQAKLDIRNAAYDLLQATTEPADWIIKFGYGVTQNGAVRCLVNLGVISAIPLSDSIPFSQLSAKLDFNQDVIERLCRYTATFGFLKEAQAGRVCHTETSRLVAENFEGLGWVLDDSAITCTRMYEALVQDPEASEPDVCGFSVANKEDGRALESLWKHQARNPRHRKGHNAAMQFDVGSSYLGSAGLAEGFDWDSLPAGATVVDVGGGKGHIMLGLAEDFPALNYVVEDRKELIEGMGESLSSKSGTTVRFTPYDFFTPQPVKANVFFFRKIFHDWPDKYCRQILSAQLPAMKQGAILIINDIVLPDFTNIPAYEEYGARVIDMVMLAYVNGKERSLEQWKALVNSVDKRFVFQSAKALGSGSAMSLIVFVFKE